MPLLRTVTILIIISLSCGSYVIADSKQSDAAFIATMENASSISDKDLARIESIYLRDPTVPNSLLSAYALSLFESKIHESIKKVGTKNRFTINSIQPAPHRDKEMPSRFSLKVKLKKESLFSTSFPSATDQLVKSQLDPLPHLSIIRFSGKVPFPIKTLTGSLDGGTLVYAPPDIQKKTGVTNTVLLLGGPKPGCVIMDGDPNDPLSFILLRDVGLVYMHGKGTVELKDGKVIKLPK